LLLTSCLERSFFIAFFLVLLKINSRFVIESKATTMYNIPKTREFLNGFSNLEFIQRYGYRKVVHINKEKAALLFLTEEKAGKWISFTSSRYYPCGVLDINSLPNFIKRHINFDVLQDYANHLAIGDLDKYADGLYFENGITVNL
jgi:hypothetical protein